MTTNTEVRIDLGRGATLDVHSFKGDKGEVVLGYLLKLKPNKPPVFMTLEGLEALQNGIVDKADKIMEGHDLAAAAIQKGYTVEFGEISKDDEEDEPEQAQSSNAGRKISFTSGRSKAKAEASF